MTSYFIKLPPKTRLLTSNQRLNRYVHAKIVRELRNMAKELAIRGKIPKMARVHTRGYLHYHDKRKRDPGNWYPSYKAVIDGVVDAGVIRDDSDEFLIFDGIHRGMPNIRGNQLVVEIWEG